MIAGGVSYVTIIPTHAISNLELCLEGVSTLVTLRVDGDFNTLFLREGQTCVSHSASHCIYNVIHEHNYYACTSHVLCLYNGEFWRALPNEKLLFLNLKREYIILRQLESGSPMKALL